MNNFIINNIILKHKSSTIVVFDIGFGIGFFMKMLYHKLSKSYKNITLSGCEPSDKEFNGLNEILTKENKIHLLNCY